jgi:hypothetical protein
MTDPMMPLANPDNRCDDCVQYRGDWCCTMNCSGAELRQFRPYGGPETVELRMADGRPRWHMATREGWQITGSADGLTLMLKASHFAVGTKITLCEPIETADQ